jgi:glycosyltransferase 2 family protein
VAEPVAVPDVASQAAPAEPGDAYRKYRRLVPWAVGLSVATLVALSLYYNARRDADVLAELRTLEPWTVPLALGLHLVMQGFWALRIKVLGGGLGAPVRYLRAQGLVTSGLFGGEPWRIAMLYRGGASGAAASRTILADRAVDMLFFMTLGILAVAFLPAVFGDTGNVESLGLLAVVGLGAMILLVVAILWRPAAIARLLARLAGVPDRVRGRPPRDRAEPILRFFHDVADGLLFLVVRQPVRLLAGAVLSVALWTCELSILWVVLQGFGFEAAYHAVFLAGVLIVMIASVPALPGGTGLAEVAALTLLTPFAPGLTPAFLVVWRGLTYYMDLLIGGVVAAFVAKATGTALPTKA